MVTNEIDFKGNCFVYIKKHRLKLRNVEVALLNNTVKVFTCLQHISRNNPAHAWGVRIGRKEGVLSKYFYDYNYSREDRDSYDEAVAYLENKLNRFKCTNRKATSHSHPILHKYITTRGYSEYRLLIVICTYMGKRWNVALYLSSKFVTKEVLHLTYKLIDRLRKYAENLIAKKGKAYVVDHQVLPRWYYVELAKIKAYIAQEKRQGGQNGK